MRKILIGAVLLVTALGVFLKLSDLTSVWTALQGVKGEWMVLAAVVQTGTYLGNAQSYAEMLRVLRFPVRWMELVRASIVSEFLADVLPSFGTSSNIYLVSLMSRKGLSLGQSAVFLMVHAATSFYAYALIAMIALGYLWSQGAVLEPIALAPAAFLIAGNLFWAVIFMIFARQGWTERVGGVFAGLIRRVMGRRFSESEFERFGNNVALGRQQIRENWKRMFAILIYKQARFLCDAVTLFFIFKSLGTSIGLHEVILAYTLAMLASSISYVPGGLGVFETTMVVTLASIGISLEIAGIATVVFRFLTFWIPLPFGVWFFQSTALGPKARGVADTSCD